VPLFDAPWLEEHRRAQEDHRLEALELLAEASLAMGGEGPVRAQLAARQLVELAPFRESGHALLMRAHAARGNHAEALQTFERVRVLLREELGSTPSPELRALHGQVLAAADVGREHEELEELPLPPVLARTEERPFVGRERVLDALRRELATTTGLHSRIFDLIQAARVDEARACLVELKQIADEIRQPIFEHFWVGWSASFAQMDGRLDDAERLAAESAVMRGRMETADAGSVFAAQLFMIRMQQGRLHELVEAVEHFMAEYSALDPWRAALPLAYIAAGREDEARERLERMVADLDTVPRGFFWLTTMTVLAEASAKLADAESAEVLYEELQPYASCIVQVGYAGCLGPVARLLGLLAAARGDREAAVAHLEAALAISQATGLRLFETQARAELDELATPSG
jgi:hypothetical protein